MYKKLIQHNSKKVRSLYFKYARDLNRALFAEDILKRSLISLLIIQDMKIKHTMTYHFTPVRMTSTEKKVLARMWRNWNPCTFLVEMENGAAAM